MKDSKNKIGKPFKPLVWFANCFYCIPFAKFKLKAKIDKSQMKGIKPPYIVLANHCSVEDFKVCAAVMHPLTPSYIGAYNQFIKREKILCLLGAIAKRQFAVDITIIKQVNEILKNNGIVTIYVESKLTSDGRTGIIPKAIAKLVKLAKVPIVILKSNGTYLDKPKWSNFRRNAAVNIKLYPLLNAEEIKLLAYEEIYDKIYKALEYDDYKYQHDNKIVVDNPNRAENLHSILYKCPSCKTEFEMASQGTTLLCNHCKKSWNLDKFGYLKANTGDTEFSTVTSWYDFERESIKNEILDGSYIFTSKTSLSILPNFKGYVNVGNGIVTHTVDGFVYNGYMFDKAEELNFSSESLYTLAYDIGKSFDISNEQTYRFYIEKKEQLTKLNIAVEEIYKLFKLK